MAKKKAESIAASQAMTPQSILELKPARAEKAFNSLPLDARQRLVLAAPWEQRRRIIMLDRDARGLVQSLPAEELYWTVLRTGIQDSLQLITLTSHEQLQFFFDMDCWDKDRLRPQAIATWYKMLSKCNELKVIEWFMEADDDFLASSLRRLLRVIKIQQQTDISEEYDEMPAATLDGIYFFVFIEKDAYGYLMPLLNTLYQHDRDRFYSLAEGMLWDSQAETEESAYEVKSRRLAEYGFPEFEDALGIYQTITDQQFEALAAAGQPAAGEKKAQSLVPRFSFGTQDMPRFFAAVLGQLPTPEKAESFQRQTVIIANKLIIADSLDIQSADDAARALRKAAGAIGIALESLGRADLNAAVAIAETNDAELLFRAGMTMVMTVARTCSAADWHIADPLLRESFMQTPRGETLHGLMQKRPVLFEGLVRSGATAYRAFMDLSELNAAAAAVAECSQIDTFLFEHMRIDPRQLFNEMYLETTLVDRSQITADAVILTAFGSVLLGSGQLIQPLTDAYVQRLLELCFYSESPGTICLKPDVRQAYFSWAASLCGERIPPPLYAYLQQLLQSFEDTFSPLAAQKIIEKRYIDKLLFKKAG